MRALNAFLILISCGLVGGWIGVATPVQAQIDAKEVLAEARQLARSGQHAEAIDRYQKLASAVEAQLGGKSLALIFVLRELAEQHHALGDLAAAEPLYRRSLEVGEENPGAEPVMLVPSLRGLAAVAAGKGDLTAAESLYEQALKSLEVAGSSDSQDASRTLAELGLLSQLQARVEKSESYYRRALSVGEASQLPEAELATIVNNLGALCAAQNRAEEAETFYRRALEMRERTLGAEHPEVAFVARELANLYQSQERWPEAVASYERALRIQEAAGQDDLALSDGLQQLALIYRRQGRLKEAEEAFQRTVTLAEANLGPDHPMVAMRLNNLAVLYADQERYDEAESLYRRSLQIEQKIYGERHLSVAVARVNLAGLYHKQGRLEQARAAAEEAKAILDDQCRLDGESDDFCREAFRAHRELTDRLAASGAHRPEKMRVAETPDSATIASPGVVSSSTPSAVAPSVVGQSSGPVRRRIYRAQVASRNQQQAAEADLEKLRRDHPAVADLTSRISQADLGEKGVWYRIQLGEFATGAEAQALCSQLAQRGHSGCFVIATDR